jgi:hypothetical protein
MNFSSQPVKRVIALACIIAGGIFVRGYGTAWKIPAFYAKYGGSVLWAAMIYFLVALLLRARPQKQVLFVAALVCALVEVTKLTHTPALDVFRMTRAGIWLLGTVFSGWNFLAYALGLGLALGLDALLIGGAFRKSRSRRR